jgi:pimeloyl-ACP methyl ester carboxylesterase
MLRRQSILLLAFSCSVFSQTGWKDPSPHRVQFVTVDAKVRLEVLDWDGRGTPIVLLPGLGNTAHVFDDFALKLNSQYHVYGITRRGFGASSVPQSGYEGDRLGDDVLAVLDSIHIDRPVLVGHSIGGTELSSIGSRHPERVAGLIYLDAGYAYAFDDGTAPTIKEMQALPRPQPPRPADSDTASFAALRAWYQRVNGYTFPEAEFRQVSNSTADERPGPPRNSPANEAIIAGAQRYRRIPAPVLAIFAVPHQLDAWMESSSDAGVRELAKTFSAGERVLVERQVKAFEQGVPSSRVVRLPGANHYVFLSNEADVLREMRAFITRLH